MEALWTMERKQKREGGRRGERERRGNLARKTKPYTCYTTHRLA